MSEQVANALCVEYMTTTKFDGWICAQFTREADATEIILRDLAFLNAVRLEARQASGLVVYATAGMLTTILQFCAWRDLC